MFIVNVTGNVTLIPRETNLAQSTFITHCTISSVGIVTNVTVIIVFLNDKKLRKKIPNIFIINQVGLI